MISIFARYLVCRTERVKWLQLSSRNNMATTCLFNGYDHDKESLPDVFCRGMSHSTNRYGPNQSSTNAVLQQSSLPHSVDNSSTAAVSRRLQAAVKKAIRFHI